MKNMPYTQENHDTSANLNNSLFWVTNKLIIVIEL